MTGRKTSRRDGGRGFAPTPAQEVGLLLYRDAKAVGGLPPIELPRCFAGRRREAMEALTNGCCGD
jgi:hypothetical protein